MRLMPVELEVEVESSQCGVYCSAKVAPNSSSQLQKSNPEGSPEAEIGDRRDPRSLYYFYEVYCLLGLELEPFSIMQKDYCRTPQL